MLQELLDLTKGLYHPKLVVVSDYKLVVGGASDILDVLSEAILTGTPWGFTRPAKKNGGSGYIVKAHAMLQTTNLTPRLVLFLFTKRPTCTFNDNVVNTALVLADMGFYIGKIDFPAMEDIGTGVSEAVATPSTVGNLPLAFKCASNSNILVGVVATRDIVTPTASDRLQINLTIEQY